MNASLEMAKMWKKKYEKARKKVEKLKAKLAGEVKAMRKASEGRVKVGRLYPLHLRKDKGKGTVGSSCPACDTILTDSEIQERAKKKGSYASPFTDNLQHAMAYFTPHEKYRGTLSLSDVEVVLKAPDKKERAKPAMLTEKRGLQSQGLGPVGEGERGTKRAREEEDGGLGEEEGGDELLDEEEEEDDAEHAERESKRRRQDEHLVGDAAGDAGAPPEDAEDVEIRALDGDLE